MEKKKELITVQHYFLFLLSFPKEDPKVLDLYNEIMDTFTLPPEFGIQWILDFKIEQLDSLISHMKKDFEEGYEVKLDLFHLLMHSYGCHNLKDKMEEIFHMISSFHLKPTIDSFNILLETFLKMRQLYFIMQYYERMIPSVFTPNGRTISIIIEVNVRKRNFDEAYKFFEEIENRQLLIPYRYFDLFIRRAVNESAEQIQFLNLIFSFGKKNNYYIDPNLFNQIESLLNQK